MKNQVMKRICKVFGSVSLAIVMTIAGSSLATLDVSAGYGESVSSFHNDTDELDGSLWAVPNDDIQIEKGKIIFSEDSSNDTRLIVKKLVENTGYSDKLLNLNCDLNFKTIAEGERFIIALAVDTVESYSEEADSLEIYIGRNGKQLYAGVRSYNESGEPQEMSDKVNLGTALGKKVTVQIQATAEQNIKIAINNKVLYNKKSPVNLEGRVMFTQSNGCVVELSNVNITSYTYDRPENSNFTEDFEKGAMNTEVLESKMGFGAGINGHARVDVVDYNGNKVLMFEDAHHLYFGTTKDYSNFEMTFDMPYLQFENILREDGSILKKAQGSMVIGIGCPPGANETFVYTHGPEALVIEKGLIYNYTTKPTIRKNFDINTYGDPENNVGYSVKIRLVDTILTISLKSRGTGKYDEMLSYKVANSNPLGRIYICTGNNLNCAIDNLTMTNLDKDGKVVEAGFSSFTPPNEDWDYKPYDAPYYKGTQEASAEPFDWILVLGGASAVGILFLAVCVTIAVIRKTPKKKKGVVSDEI